MNYKQGLAALRKLAEGHDWFIDLLLYEARLLENLEQERLYGSSEQYRVTRAQIVDQLNRLAYAHLNISFNDLCRGISPQVHSTSRSTGSKTRRSLQAMQEGTPKDAMPSRIPRTDVFISYSHQDKKYRAELERHLKLYMRSEIIKVWNDTLILPGAKWREEIVHALQRTKVAILLVSADFLASDFIVNEELPPLLNVAEQGDVKILCVILSSCDFENTDLTQFKFVNAPSRPLSGMARGKREEVWLQVAKLVKEIIQST